MLRLGRALRARSCSAKTAAIVWPSDGDGVSERTCLAIVLAAGEGTRMRSRVPKVLHAVGRRSLLSHVLTTVQAAGTSAAAVVIGPGHSAVDTEVKRIAPCAQVFVQHERRGTAHAALCAAALVERGWDDVLIAFADSPLVRPATWRALRNAIAKDAAVAVLGFRPANPLGYGRLI